MALRNAFKMVPGLRKQIGERDERVMAIKLIEELRMSSFEVAKKTGMTGHVLDPPSGDAA